MKKTILLLVLIIAILCTVLVSGYYNKEIYRISSGQNVSYQVGDDGYYQDYRKNWTTNGTVVVDSDNGIMWGESGGAINWTDAINKCHNSNYSGYTDWHLTTYPELLAAIDFSCVGGVPNCTREFVNNHISWASSAGSFWTSTLYTTGAAYYWIFNLGGMYQRTLTYSSYYYLCSRQNSTDKATFYTGQEVSITTGDDASTYNIAKTLLSTEISSDTVVIDLNTNLMWNKNALSTDSWSNQVSYCNNSDYAGFNDWRLANILELSTSLDYSCTGTDSRCTSARQNNLFDWPAGDIWSSTTNPESTGNKYYLQLTGFIYSTTSPTSKSGRCVRSIDSGPSPNASTIIWSTTGGLTDNTLVYSQVLDYINATCSDETGLQDCNLTVANPDGTLVVNNVAMTNASNDFTYTTNINLNVAGTWTINVTATDTSANENTSSTTFTVSTVTQSLIDGYYAYDTQTIPSNSEIEALSTYGYDLLLFRDLATTMGDNWTAMKAAITKANLINMKVGLAYDLNYNLDTGSADTTAFMLNITAHLPDIAVTPYRETVEFILIIANDTYNGAYTDAMITTDNVNQIGKNISDVDGNAAVYYSSYNSSTLDTNYIQPETFDYVTGADNGTLINNLAALTKATNDVTRIYYSLDDSTKTTAQKYQTNILQILTGDVNASSNIANLLVSELSNGDLIIYNNQSTAQNFTYNVGAGTDVNSSDIWDFNNDILLESNSDGTVTFLDIPAWTVHLIGTENINHIAIGSDLTTSTVFKASADAIDHVNYTDATRDGASDATTSRAVELWDGTYVNPTTMIYYGLLNVTGIKSPYVFDGYKYLIIADKTDAEVDALFWANVSITNVCGYVSVGDYNATNGSWLAGKQGEVDAWLAINDSLCIFTDGLDSGSLGAYFEESFTLLADYIKTTKGKNLAVNVFTNYQSFAQHANLFAMKESCVHRWQYVNGVDATGGYNYSNQFWEDSGGYGDYNKSIWYNNHNVDVVCVPFIERNNTAYQPTTANYTLREKLFFKASVLGYDNIVMSTPNFAIAYFDKEYDIGTKLQSEPTVSGKYYSMRYTNGIVWYNSTSDESGFIDGRTFNNASITAVVHDTGAAAVDYNFCVNDYCGYTLTTDGSGFAYETQSFDINETVFDASGGHYLVNTTSTAGGFVGTDTDVATYGKHSYYDNSGVWAVESDATGNHMFYLITNTTNKIAIDTTTKITQTQTLTSQEEENNFTSSYNFSTLVRTYQSTVAGGTFRWVKVYNGSSYVTITNYTNSTACTTDNPVFSYNSLSGITGNVGVCIDPTTASAKVEYPTSSYSESFIFGADNTVPTITSNYPLDTTNYNGNYNGSILLSLNEDGGNCTINDTRWTYSSGSATTFNFVNTSSINNVNTTINISCWDDDNNNGSKLLSFSTYTLPAVTIYSNNNGCRGTRTTIFAAFGLIALLVLAGAAFGIIQTFQGGDMMSSLVIATGGIAVAIALMVGAYIVSVISLSVCV